MSVTEVEEAWREVALEAGAPAQTIDKWWSEFISRKNIFRQIELFRRHVEPCLPPETRTQFLLALFFREAEQPPITSSEAAAALPEPQDGVRLVENFFADAGIINENLKKSTIEILDKAAEGDVILSDDPVAFFRDLELAPLGLPADEYKKYVEEAKEEYHPASLEQYRSTRLKVLQMLLLIPRIFISDVFHDQFEVIARENISEEIKSLAC